VIEDSYSTYKLQRNNERSLLHTHCHNKENSWLSTLILHLRVVYNGQNALYGFTQTGEGGKGEVPCQIILVLKWQKYIWQCPRGRTHKVYYEYIGR